MDKSLETIVLKLKSAAQKASQVTGVFDRSAPEQVSLIFVMVGTQSGSALRRFGERSVIAIERKDFEASTLLDTVAHEAAHAVFEHHSVPTAPAKKAVGHGAAPAAPGSHSTAPAPGSAVPDALALRFANLFSRLATTPQVPVPTGKFDPQRPPPLKDGTQPVGYVMVTDVLWSGSGGHAQSDVSEFFASAYGAFVQDPGLLKRILAYYCSHFPELRPLVVELLTLLAAVGDPKALQALAGPSDAAALKAARETVKAVPPTPSYGEPGKTDALFSGTQTYMLDPDAMPGPATIKCSP